MPMITQLAKSRTGVQPRQPRLGSEVMLARRKGNACDLGHADLKVLQDF